MSIIFGMLRNLLSFSEKISSLVGRLGLGKDHQVTPLRCLDTCKIPLYSVSSHKFTVYKETLKF